MAGGKGAGKRGGDKSVRGEESFADPVSEDSFVYLFGLRRSGGGKL